MRTQARGRVSSSYRRVAVCVFVTGLLLAGGAGIARASGVGMPDTFCGAAPGQLSLTPVNTPSGGLTSLVVSGIDASQCELGGLHVVMAGNGDGSPSSPASTIYGDLDAEHDPCTGAVLGEPVKVVEGSITLPTCNTGTSGGAATIREITEFRLYAGAIVEVLGETYSQSSSGIGRTGTATVTHGSGLLPFTGAWISFLVRVGLWLILAGVGLWWIGAGRTQRENG